MYLYLTIYQVFVFQLLIQILVISKLKNTNTNTILLNTNTEVFDLPLVYNWGKPQKVLISVVNRMNYICLFVHFGVKCPVLLPFFGHLHRVHVP